MTYSIITFQGAKMRCMCEPDQTLFPPSQIKTEKSGLATRTITIPPYYSTTNETVPSTTLYLLPHSSTMAYQSSYFNEWNILPKNLIEVADTDVFKTRLHNLYI